MTCKGVLNHCTAHTVGRRASRKSVHQVNCVLLVMFLADHHNFVGWWMSIVSNKEMFVWQIVNPLSQFNASIECSCIVCPARSNDTKVNKSEVSIRHRLDIHSVSLAMTTEVVRCVVNILWFVDATEPSINCTNTAMECSKGPRLLIPFSSTSLQLCQCSRNIDGK